MLDLTDFRLRDMTACGAALRKIGAGAATMEEVADRIIQYIYDAFVDPHTGEKSLALVRLFKTHPYEDLEPALVQIVDQALGTSVPSPRMKCLTLLASRGAQANWNLRQGSQGHQAIPLVSEAFVAKIPMISQLIRQMGLEIGTVLEPDPALLVDLEQRTFNVFHIPEALGSPYVPAQAEFVIPYQLQSVLGFGGMLPSGNLLVVIMFSRTQISRETADMFKTLALNVKMALLPFDGSTVFQSSQQ